MKDVLKRVGTADASEIDEILWACIQRRRALYPDWDFVFVSMPKDDPQERKRILHGLICQLNLEAERGSTMDNAERGRP